MTRIFDKSKSPLVLFVRKDKKIKWKIDFILGNTRVYYGESLLYKGSPYYMYNIDWGVILICIIMTGGFLIIHIIRTGDSIFRVVIIIHYTGRLPPWPYQLCSRFFSCCPVLRNVTILEACKYTFFFYLLSFIGCYL